MGSKTELSEMELKVARAAKMYLQIFGITPGSTEIEKATGIDAGQIDLCFTRLEMRGVINVARSPKKLVTEVHIPIAISQRVPFFPSHLWFGILDLVGNTRDFIFMTKKDDKLFQFWKRTSEAKIDDFVMLFTPEGIQHTSYKGTGTVFAVLVGEYYRV